MIDSTSTSTVDTEDDNCHLSWTFDRFWHLLVFFRKKLFKNDLAGENECCGLSLKLLFYFFIFYNWGKTDTRKSDPTRPWILCLDDFFPKNIWISFALSICLSNNVFKTKWSFQINNYSHDWICTMRSLFSFKSLFEWLFRML